MSFSSKIYSLYQPICSFFENIIQVQRNVDSDEAYTRIEQESIYSDGIDRVPFWGGFSRKFISRINSSLETVVSQFEKEGVNNKTALDLGCGKADSTLYLLKKGWNVIAVDSSKEALDNLNKVARSIDSTNKGKLTLVNQEIEKYDFPKNITLIVANRSLPYLNPLKIRGVWDKIHDALEPGGRVLGNFFPKPWLPFFEVGSRAIMGTWFVDKASVEALLKQKNYQIETCYYGDFWSNSTRTIEFIGKKEEHPLNKKGLFSIHLSSYFDAVKGLPSKALFPHFIPFLADRLIELRELNKLITLASGIVTATQLLLHFDSLLSSYVFSGSITAWFIFKHFMGMIENKALTHIQLARNFDYKNSPELKEKIQKIQQLQQQKEIQELFNPPTPKTERELMREFLQNFEINLSEEDIQRLNL